MLIAQVGGEFMDNLDLKQFNQACDEFASGKYILANIKIKAIINCVSQSPKLTDLITACLQDFDFNLAFQDSITEQGLQIPQGEKCITAYCFNILYNIDRGSINFLDFLSKYFSGEEITSGEEFKLFVDVIVAPFKTSVNKLYEDMYLMTESEDYQNNTFHKIENVAKCNLDIVDTLKLKEIAKDELSLLLNAFVTASDKNDLKTIYALMVGLEYFAKANKGARAIYLQLKDCFLRN